MAFMESLDWLVLNWIQEIFRCKAGDLFMPMISFVCNRGEIWILIGVVLLFMKKHRKTGILLLAGLLAGFLIGNVFLKNALMRERPCWLNPDVVLLVKNPTDYSFPSGHTLASTIAAVILTKGNRRFGFWAIPLAILIGFSRLYLYVHFPTDVLGAVVLGCLIGSVVFSVGMRWLSKGFSGSKKS